MRAALPCRVALRRLVLGGYNFPPLPGGFAASSGQGDEVEDHPYLVVIFLTCSLLFTADPAMGGQ